MADQEEERLEFLKSRMWDYANGLSTLAMNEDEVCSIRGLDPESRCLFRIAGRRSGRLSWGRPAPAPCASGPRSRGGTARVPEIADVGLCQRTLNPRHERRRGVDPDVCLGVDLLQRRARPFGRLRAHDASQPSRFGTVYRGTKVRPPGSSSKIKRRNGSSS
jgi:hypothetical protein